MTQARGKIFALAGVMALSFSISAPADVADVASDLEDFWARTGGGINLSKPTAFEGQRAGHATMGSLYLRTQNRASGVASVQLPSVRAGCGGIDIFAGAFSFINSENLVAMSRAIMQNAVSFAFELALESLSPATKEIMDGLRDLSQRVNQMNINSCEAGQMILADGLSRMDYSSQHLCRTIGDMEGDWADRIAGRANCGGGSTTETLKNASGALADQIPVDINYAWRAIQKNTFLAANREIAEFFMTLAGTVIVQAGKTDDQGPQYRTLQPLGLTPATAKAMIEGGAYTVYRCNETTKCLNPTKTTKTMPPEKGLFKVTLDRLEALSNSIDADTSLPADVVDLINLTSLPVHRHLVVAKSYKYQFAADDMNSIAEMVAVDLTLKYIEEALFEMVKGSSAVKISGGETEKFEARLRESRDVVMNLRREAFERYAQAVLNVERVAKAEETLAAFGQTRFGEGFNTEGE